MKTLGFLKEKWHQAKEAIFWYFKGIKVYALVGESGTGKSFRAQMVAEKYNIPLIIDDGLLIKRHIILAGQSAKKAKGKIQAVKIAIFQDENHRKEVVKALQKERFSIILILGTSQKMVNKIVERLGLPAITRFIYIEEIATPEEIALAKTSRQKGEHVIPVPSVAMTGDYSQIFYDSVKIFFKNPFYFFWKRKPKTYEKSVVKPAFARVGTPNFSQNAILEMVKHTVADFDPRIKIDRMRIKSQENNRYSFFIDLMVPQSTEILSMSEDLKKSISLKVERYANLDLDSVEIHVKGVIDPSQELNLS